MALFRNCPLLTIAALLLFPINVLAQNVSVPESAVKTVQVTASAQEAEVGQKVKLSVTATDASGKVVKEQPSVYFAGPFDIAAVDDDGNVILFGAGEVTVGAIVGGKPGITTFMVKPPSIKTIEIASLKTPLVVGGTTQLNALHAFSTAIRAPAFRSIGLPTTRKSQQWMLAVS